jgi:hypothetical protein
LWPSGLDINSLRRYPWSPWNSIDLAWHNNPVVGHYGRLLLQSGLLLSHNPLQFDHPRGQPLTILHDSVLDFLRFPGESAHYQSVVVEHGQPLSEIECRAKDDSD